MKQSTNKNRQLFAKLGHNFANDPKIMTLSDGAFRAYVESLLYACANMTDGFLDERVLRKFGWLQHADELTQNDANASWSQVDGGYQIYAFCEWQMTSEDHKKRVESGRLGGLAKAKNKRTPSKDVAGAKQVVEQTSSDSLLDKNRKEEDKNIALESAYSDDFEEWWSVYPAKKAKGAAARAFEKALQRVTFSELMEKTRAYAESDLPDPQFIPHGSTWLNSDRWMDEIKPKWVDPDAWMQPKKLTKEEYYALRATW